MGFYKGWRYAAFISGIVGFIGLAMYPIAIRPMMDPSEYKKIQKEARKNIRQEDIQPGTYSEVTLGPVNSGATKKERRFNNVINKHGVSSKYESVDRSIWA